MASSEIRAKFSVGELVQHNRFGYRGVIFDVDPDFQGSEDWYKSVARSKPPRDKPWYHVLPHESSQSTYVAERHLAPDPSHDPIRHPDLERLLGRFAEGSYQARHRLN